MKIEERLQDLEISLPAVGDPGGSYVHSVRVGELIFLSGKVPRGADGTDMVGKVGLDITTEQAYQHARLVGLMLISVLKNELVDLDRVKQIVKVFGMVNATTEFKEHAKVINGCSDIFIDVFGNRGKHARSAVGMGSLPSGFTVEIEAIVHVE